MPCKENYSVVMRIISINETSLSPLIQMGASINDLTPEGLGDTGFHLVVLSDEQYSAMQQLYGKSMRGIEDITPKGVKSGQQTTSGFLFCKGGKIPNGIKLRASYLSRYHQADVRNGKIWIEQKSFNNPSSAARSITKSQVNGWDFWGYQDKATGKWQTLSRLRQ